MLTSIRSIIRHLLQAHAVRENGHVSTGGQTSTEALQMPELTFTALQRMDRVRPISSEQFALQQQRSVEESSLLTLPSLVYSRLGTRSKKRALSNTHFPSRQLTLKSPKQISIVPRRPSLTSTKAKRLKRRRVGV